MNWIRLSDEISFVEEIASPPPLSLSLSLSPSRVFCGETSASEERRAEKTTGWVTRAQGD